MEEEMKIMMAPKRASKKEPVNQNWLTEAGGRCRESVLIEEEGEKYYQQDTVIKLRLVRVRGLYHCIVAFVEHVDEEGEREGN